jgi:hypothetical protein
MKGGVPICLPSSEAADGLEAAVTQELLHKTKWLYGTLVASVIKLTMDA